MIAHVVKRKVKSVLMFLLILCLVSQSVTPAFAGDNSGQITTPNSANTTVKYLTSMKQNLAVMLYAGDKDEFVLDRSELIGRSQTTNSALDDVVNKGYRSMSISKAYAEIFRRTQVSWNSPGVKETLIMMGPDNTWGYTGPGGITTSANGNSAENAAFYQHHRMNVQTQSTYDSMVTGWLPAWGASAAPVGNGVYKERITKYLTDYFNAADKASFSPQPAQFVQSLVDNSSSDDKLYSQRVWNYIAAGANAVQLGYVDESPGIRWKEVFAGASSLSADTTFLGDGFMFEQDGAGAPKELKGWEEDPRVFDNIAGYLDTLVTLGIVAQQDSAADVGGYYLDAAKLVFGSPGTYATEVEDLQQTKSIIFDTWSSQTYGAAGQASRGTAVTYTDNWGVYRRMYRAGEGTPRVDWRSSNPDYNDYYAYPALFSSPTFSDWVSKIPDSSDRIGVRLSTLDTDRYPINTMVNNSKIDISVGSIWFPALAGLGPTSASIGRSAGETHNTELYAGLKSDKPSRNYLGFDWVERTDLVSGQFLVYMFGQAADVPESGLETSQSLIATPDDLSVDRATALNQRINVTYKVVVGRLFKPAQGGAYQEAVVDPKALANFTRDFQVEQKDVGAELYARTYFTRKVTEYKLNTLWLAGADTATPAILPGIAADTTYTDLKKTTNLGLMTVDKTVFDDPNGGWNVVDFNKFKTMQQADAGVMISLQDDDFLTKQWNVLSDPKPVKDGNMLYKPGYDFYLKVSYEANTEFQIRTTNAAETIKLSNYTGRTGASLDAYGPDPTKVPAYLSQDSTGALNFVTDTASFKYYKDPEAEPVPADPLVKAHIPYGVYSSSPEAYAELKNWGVASVNEPQDGTGLGDSRSPVDTQLGVSASTKSNGSSVINEDYEAMAGVPTTEKLYLAVGGSEFIVDIAVQYVPNETAVRSYNTHFDGVPSQFNYASASGAGGDTPDDTVWGSHVVPQPKGLTSGMTATVTTSNGGGSINPHDGGTYTLTVGGTIHNVGVDGKQVISDHDGGTYPYDYGNGKGSDSNFAPRADATEQGSNGSGSQLTASEAAKGNGMPLVGAQELTRVLNTTHDNPESWAWAVPKVSDVLAFNTSMDTTVKQWIDDMVVYFNNSPSFKAGSDGITRRFGDGTTGEFIYTKDLLQDNMVGYPVLTPDDGDLTVTPPTDLFGFAGDVVAGEAFNIVSFRTTDVYDVANPANKTATASSSDNGTLRTVSYDIKTSSSGTDFYVIDGQAYVAPTEPDEDGSGGDPGQPYIADSQGSNGYTNSASWSGSITGNWTDGFDIEWFASTTEGQAEYEAFVLEYEAAVKDAEAWVEAEMALTNVTTAGSYGGALSGLQMSGASVDSNEFKDNDVAFVPDTGSGTATAVKDTDYDWSASYTFDVQPHTLCGPDCGHNLPDINDAWQQSFNYDYLKIIGLSVLRLDQGSASDNTVDGSGLNALIGTTKLGVTKQTYYSSPTMNLAQANIFNYMGLQGDGGIPGTNGVKTTNLGATVNDATNNYFRSIAYGLNLDGTATTWGNTKSSEANRVKYWMTNADGSTLTSKGPTFQRLTYTGNTAGSVPFANEVLSVWGEGLLLANDQVTYNMGNRSNTSDGTSRGYKYNVNKSSWIEQVNGTWRGKAAYDLPWATGFIYDGVKSNGSVDASGFSVSRLYRNDKKSGSTGLEGIVQDDVKGWQGTGMNTSTQASRVEAYTVGGFGGAFELDYYTNSSKVKLYHPAIRDWSLNQHQTYTDTFNLPVPGGNVIKGAENGDLAPRTYVAAWWLANAVKTDDTLAQAQPYATDDMLMAYTNTASDGGAKIRNTPEFKLMQAKRDEKVQATVISDALVLDLPNGLQPIMYHYRNASASVSSEDRIPDTRIGFDTSDGLMNLWTNNLFTPNSWSDSLTGTKKDGIRLGSYNGDLTNSRVTGVNDVQKRLQERTDAIPATPNMYLTPKAATIEDPSGVVGKALGAKVINGTNINLYMAHNTLASTRILSLPVTNKSAVGAPVQRTLLYNISPIVLSADNREYKTGSAEAFWETIVQWKDSSNHDYYGKYVEGAQAPDMYISPEQYVRLPALLGNYGQVEYDKALHTEVAGKALLAGYFIDAVGIAAYGAEQARDAQAEQYSRGFGTTGYNYDTTNTEAIAGKYSKNMYNPSPELTGAAAGNAYVTDGNLGVPFILEGVTTAGFSTTTATRNVGTLRAGLAKSGYIQAAAYTRADGANGKYALNNVVIHNPISARATQIMPIAAWRDQRTYGQSLVSTVREAQKKGCPGTVELCEFSYLDDKYDKPLELLNLNLTGSGSSVTNTAANVAIAGNILFAGSYAMSGTGLSSNGSARTGVSLTDIGGAYYSSLDYQVTAPITYAANTGEQMLFGFEGYGITLNTATKKLAIRVDGAAGYIDVAGTFNSGDTLKVAFGSSNASLSKVWVNGVLRVVSMAGGNTFDSMLVTKSQVGNTFYIGSWNSGGYLPTASTKYQSLLFERLAGSRAHTLACATTVVHHVGGNNTHLHTVDDLGATDDTHYLNGTLQDWNDYKISDGILRDRLGDVLYTALGLPKAQTTTIVDSDEVLISDSPIVSNFGTVGTTSYTAPSDGVYKLETWGAAGGGDTPHDVTVTGSFGSQAFDYKQVVASAGSAGSQSYSYTGGIQTFTATKAGTYTLEVWGAQGGPNGNRGAGGNGGYAKGDVTLSVGDSIQINVASMGAGSTATGWAGNPMAGGYPNGGQGAIDTDDDDNDTNESGGGGGGGSYITLNGSAIIAGGGGGGSVYTNTGGTGHVGGGGGGSYNARGYDGGSVSGVPAIGGSNGAHGSGWTGSLANSSTSTGVRTGSGYATVSWSALPTYTGDVQTFTAPVTGNYTFETWGAQGSASVFQPTAQLGGYSKGTKTLNAGQTVYIYVGGQGSYTGGATAGGYNGGGGAVQASGHQGGSGGGATHIATVPGLLSDLSGNQASILLVAGGAGGNGDSVGGNGGGATGGAGTPLGGYSGYANGGTQTAGGTAWGDTDIGYPGSFGQGGKSDITCSGGGGGGFYGGGGAYPVGGGGGSGYTGGVAGGTMSNGVRSGNGYAVVSWNNPAISGTVGSVGGLGGYSSGYVSLQKGAVLSVNVGGQGTMAEVGTYGGGGYNGGGNGANTGFGGGGATDIRATGKTDVLSSTNANIGKFADTLGTTGNPSKVTLPTGETAIKINAGSQHVAAGVPNVFIAGHIYQVSFEAWSTATSDVLHVDACPDTLPEASITLSSQRKTYTTTISSNLPEMNSAMLRIFASGEIFAGDVYVTNVKVYDVSALTSRVIVAGGGGGADDTSGELAGTANDGSGGAGGAWGGPASLDGLAAVDGGVIANLLSYENSFTNAASLSDWTSFNFGGAPTILAPEGANGLKLTRSGIGDSGAMLYVDGLQSNTDYILSGYVNSTGGDDGNGAICVVNQTNSVGLSATHFTANTDGGFWGITNKFNTGSNTAVYLRLDGVAGTMWIRSLVLKKVTDYGGWAFTGMDNGYALGQGASATLMTDTGGGGGGYYGGYTSNHYNGGGSGGTSYLGGVTSGTYLNGVRYGNGYATITAPNETPSKSYTFTVTGGPKQFDASAVRTSGTGSIQIDLYKGSVADPSELLGSNMGTPNAVYPAYGTQTTLPVGTYTVVVKSTDNTDMGVHFNATLKGRNLQYADIMALSSINGAEAWRQIPYYLSNGSRNPVYACNGELNAHVDTIQKNEQFSYTGGVQTFTASQAGTYTFEVWGAQGGGSSASMKGAGYTVGEGAWVDGGLGGYTKGTVSLTAGQTISIYVGGIGVGGSGHDSVNTTGSRAGGFNGGGLSGAAYQAGGGGGGATDIRLNGAALSNRVIVAGGGGGTSNWSNTVSGGVGGGTTGGSGKLNVGAVPHTLATGGTQSAGGSAGQSGQAGSLGQGGNSEYSHGGGGGGGYYGGGGGGVIASGVSSAGGGSGYIGGVTSGTMSSGVQSGNGKAVITWSEPTLCYTETVYDKCTEPHHTGGHYHGDPLCYSPCLDDANHDTNLVQNHKVNTPAAQFVSLDWDYTLYADSIDNFRSGTHSQLTSTANNTGLGYYDTNVNGDFDDVRFIRGKYIKFPWFALYDGVLYNPGEWIVLGDRGNYAKGNVTLANNGTGFGGNVQTGANGLADLYDSKQASAYNVQNWSLYNQQIYKDLYKDFYDFYVPLNSDELSLGEVAYAKVGVNSLDGRDGVTHTGIPGTLNELANLNSWLKDGAVSNRKRDMNNASIGAGKLFYVDVVGRIGGLVAEDTTDVKFSNTFKEALAPVSESLNTYDIDMTDLSGVKPGRLTKALQVSSSIVTGGRLLNPSGSLPARASLTTTSDWVGYDYSGGNARKYSITVTGNNLKAGELTVGVTDAANGDYTLRLSDMTVVENTNQVLSVQCDVKQTNASVSIKPRFELLDTSVGNVYVSSMTGAVGGSGFGQGLSKEVDVTQQNYYITDVTDVRGIYLGATATTGSATEGLGALAWSRYDSFNDVGNWIRMSDATQVRDTQHISQRTIPEYGTRAVNTYGTRPWVQINDPAYEALNSNGGRAIVGPLTSSHNTIEQYRTPNDQLSVGSKIFYDITTVGSYAGLDATMKIMPSYYLVDATKQDANGAVALVPVDIYQFSSAGNYQPVNIFGATYGGFTDTQLDEFNQYRLSVNWDDEAVASRNRRMVTNDEYQAAQAYSDMFKENTYTTNPYESPGLSLDDPTTYPTPSGTTSSPRVLPSGVMQIGGAQFIQQGYQTQTYIGSNFTYGVDKSGGLFAPYASNPTQNAKYIYWQVSAQRWHTSLGLPSDSVFVPLAQDPVTHKFVHRDLTDVQANAVDIKSNLIVGYIDVYANGSIWNLHYGSGGIQRTLTVEGVDYKLPISGPSGPSQANPYTGQTSVGTDYTNGGIPFVVFGGTRVQGQTDIIKVN